MVMYLIFDKGLRVVNWFAEVARCSENLSILVFNCFACLFVHQNVTILDKVEKGVILRIVIQVSPGDHLSKSDFWLGLPLFLVLNYYKEFFG